MLSGILKNYKNNNGKLELLEPLNFHYYKTSEIPADGDVVIYGGEFLDIAFIKAKLEANNQIIILPETKYDLSDPPQSELLRNPAVTVICQDLNDYQQLVNDKTTKTLYFDYSHLPYITKKVILLMRDANRVKHVQRQLLEPLSNITVFPAIDAQTPGALDNFLDGRGLKIVSAMKAGMVGCMCSHYSIWSNLLESQDPAWLVLEDDISPMPRFQKEMKAVLNELPPTFDFLYLYISPDYYRDDESVQLPGKKSINQAYENYNSSAYLITRQGAEKLLSRFENISDKIDQIIWQEIKTGNLEAYCVKRLLFDNIGLKTETASPKREPKLASNILHSRVYRPSTPTGFLSSFFSQAK